MNEKYLIETDAFPIEMVSLLADRESWRKEVHRPVYHVHKWWAKRLGSVFRAILLGCRLPANQDLMSAFYTAQNFAGTVVFDPFMGSGTTVGEAHKLGFTALGRDINPVAYRSGCVAFGPLKQATLDSAFKKLATGVAPELQAIYRTQDSEGNPCDVLYFFWVMEVDCPSCSSAVSLFSSYTFAQNAYPKRKPETQVVCPQCAHVSEGRYGSNHHSCPSCGCDFDPGAGPAKGQKATCTTCRATFPIASTISKSKAPPRFRQYAKLVLYHDGTKRYLRTTPEDDAHYASCCDRLDELRDAGKLLLPDLKLTDGHNTRQAMGYNFHNWRDFFNKRQLLALSLLRAAILQTKDVDSREALLTLFSGTLEFNNMFASYKGEGTGAVRHMFSHHVLKPERTPIEANVWGTPKSSGSFSGLFRSRLLRAVAYRSSPVEIAPPGSNTPKLCSPPFSGTLSPWPRSLSDFRTRGIHLSCGDSSSTQLPPNSVDLVVTDPPFFDNVHYSELADFFQSWHAVESKNPTASTRSAHEVQDADAGMFSEKLSAVFSETYRVLKDDGILAFSYHHSRDDGWTSVAAAILRAGFRVINAHPVKAEMSAATPKSQSKEPIQLDTIIVCRKASACHSPPLRDAAFAAATLKADRLRCAGFSLSRNDVRVILYGQMLSTIVHLEEIEAALSAITEEIIHQIHSSVPQPSRSPQMPLDQLQLKLG